MRRRPERCGAGVEPSRRVRRRTLRGMKISARNQIPARVVSVTEGPATAIVKASDVMLGVAD